MNYNLFGKDINTDTTLGKVQLYRELMYNPKLTTNRALDDAKKFLRIQQEINAEDRTARETNPERKRLMERMMANGMTNFDHYFGPENK